MDLKKLPIFPYGFVCGIANTSGLQSQLYIQEKFTLLPVRFTDKHTGYPGYVHGGIVSSALDEAMAWSAARYFRRMCVTAELTVRFLKRVPLNKELLVKAWIAKEHRLLANTESVLIDEGSNKVLVKAWGKFMPISKEETQMVDKCLMYDENTERIFSEQD